MGENATVKNIIHNLKSKIDDRRESNCYKYTIFTCLYQTHSFPIPMDCKGMHERVNKILHESTYSKK